MATPEVATSENFSIFDYNDPRMWDDIIIGNSTSESPTTTTLGSTSSNPETPDFLTLDELELEQRRICDLYNPILERYIAGGCQSGEDYQALLTIYDREWRRRALAAAGINRFLGEFGPPHAPLPIVRPPLLNSVRERLYSIGASVQQQQNNNDDNNARKRAWEEWEGHEVREHLKSVYDRCMSGFERFYETSANDDYDEEFHSRWGDGIRGICEVRSKSYKQVGEILIPPDSIWHSPNTFIDTLNEKLDKGEWFKEGGKDFIPEFNLKILNDERIMHVVSEAGLWDWESAFRKLMRLQNRYAEESLDKHLEWVLLVMLTMNRYFYFNLENGRIGERTMVVSPFSNTVVTATEHDVSVFRMRCNQIITVPDPATFQATIEDIYYWTRNPTNRLLRPSFKGANVIKGADGQEPCLKTTQITCAELFLSEYQRLFNIQRAGPVRNDIIRTDYIIEPLQLANRGLHDAYVEMFTRLQLFFFQNRLHHDSALDNAEELGNHPDYARLIEKPQRLAVEERKQVFNTYPGLKYKADSGGQPITITRPKEKEYFLMFILNHIRMTCETDEQFIYLLGWMACMLQYPWLRSGTIWVLFGPQGTGKTTILEMLMEFVGEEANCVHGQSIEDMAGRFREHKKLNVYEECVTTLISEQAENEMKNLTARTLRTEAKHVKSSQVKNYANTIISTNDPKHIPMPTAQQQDRRFILNYVDIQRYLQHLECRDPDTWARKDYFQMLAYILQNGGKRLFANFLYHLDLNELSLTGEPFQYNNIPKSQVKLIHSFERELVLKPYLRAWVECIKRGYHCTSQNQWTAEVKASNFGHVIAESIGFNGHFAAIAVYGKIKEYCKELHYDHTQKTIRVPPLETCIENLEEKYPGFKNYLYSHNLDDRRTDYFNQCELYRFSYDTLPEAVKKAWKIDLHRKEQDYVRYYLLGISHFNKVAQLRTEHHTQDLDDNDNNNNNNNNTNNYMMTIIDEQPEIAEVALIPILETLQQLSQRNNESQNLKIAVSYINSLVNSHNRVLDYERQLRWAYAMPVQAQDQFTIAHLEKQIEIENKHYPDRKATLKSTWKNYERYHNQERFLEKLEHYMKMGENGLLVRCDPLMDYERGTDPITGEWYDRKVAALNFLGDIQR